MHATISELYRQLRGHGFSENNRFLDKSPYWQLLHKALLSITFSGLDDDLTTSFARLGNPFSDPVGVEDLVQNELEF